MANHNSERRFPGWFTKAGHRLPEAFPLTPRVDGWCKSINGKTRWICGKLAPRDALAVWRKKSSALYAAHPSEPRRPAPKELTVLLLAQVYLTWMNVRLTTGKPKPLAPRTYADVQATLQMFLDVRTGGGRMADLPVAELLDEAGPRHFSAFAAAIPGQSPYTKSRHIAYIQAMFGWAGPGKRGMHHIDRAPNYGPDCQKAAASELRHARGAMDKPWPPAKFQAAMKAVKGDTVKECFLLLGATCAMLASDIASLPDSAVNLERGVIDFARVKTGEYRRCPMVPALITAMRKYRQKRFANMQPDAPWSDLFFITRYGRPYCRIKEGQYPSTSSRAGQPRHTPIDTISRMFGELMDKMEGDRRGFSGLRTTFRMLADQCHERHVDIIMGHTSGELSKISSHYVPPHKIPLDELRKVTDHVYAAITAKARVSPAPEKPKQTSEKQRA